MGKIISVVNQRRSSGKTATAVNLAAAFGLMEKRTLLVDCDPQGEASECMKISTSPADPTLLGAMAGKVDVRDLAKDTELEFLKVVPAGIDLFAAEQFFGGTGGREGLLGDVLSGVAQENDFIVIDTPSSLGFLTTSAVAASHLVVVPVSPGSETLPHLGLLLQTIATVRREMSHNIRIAAIIFTRCGGLDEVNRHVPPDWMEKVGRNVLLATVAEYEGRNGGAKDPAFVLKDVASKTAEDYLGLAVELAKPDIS